MLRAAVLLASIMMATAVAAQGRRADAPVFGTGSLQCAQAIAPERLAATREWVFGYLTAFGESFGPPAIWLGDPDAIARITDESCAAFPKFTLVEAARWVILTLQMRHYDKRK